MKRLVTPMREYRACTCVVPKRSEPSLSLGNASFKHCSARASCSTRSHKTRASLPASVSAVNRLPERMKISTPISFSSPRIILLTPG
ncbi:hypothetical protein D9M68_901130 [compost metagenome]